MNLIFVKLDNQWVSEISVSANFNLHIEGVIGKISVFQRTTETGGYANIKEAASTANSEVYDKDFIGEIYPKYIRVVCATEPTMAEVTSEGEVIQIEIPVEPEEPEVLTYHFEFNNMTLDEHDPINTGYYETQSGDYNELHSKLVAFIKANGESIAENLFNCMGEAVTSGTNITLNGYKVDQFELSGDTHIILYANEGPSNPSWSTYADFYTDRISYNSPTNAYKPEIEYHFELEMDEDSEGLSGYAEGDFSDVVNKLLSFCTQYDNNPSRDVVAEKTNITINEDKVVAMDCWVEGREVYFTTNAPMHPAAGFAQANLTTTDITYERGK